MIDFETVLGQAKGSREAPYRKQSCTLPAEFSFLWLVETMGGAP